jgi:hypothetical protein
VAGDFAGGSGGMAGDSWCAGAADLGSMDSRFMSSCMRLCSAAACPSVELFFACSIECNNCAPSALLLLTKDSTFFSRLSTLSFISL